MLSDARLAAVYVAAKRTVLAAGYGDELCWQRTRRFSQIDESTLLREAAWVILSSGLREAVIQAKFLAISHAFFDWETAAQIASSRSDCVSRALCQFNHRRKIEAIASTAVIIASRGFAAILREMKIDPICALRQFPYIGPITSFHLAKNLGLPVSKADRHLVRLAKTVGFEDVQSMCSNISQFTGDPVAVVDIVLWRISTIRSKQNRSIVNASQFSDC